MFNFYQKYSKMNGVKSTNKSLFIATKNKLIQPCVLGRGSHLLRGHENVSHLFDPLMMVSATRAAIKQSPETLALFPTYIPSKRCTVSTGMHLEYHLNMDSLEQTCQMMSDRYLFFQTRGISAVLNLC